MLLAQGSTFTPPLPLLCHKPSSPRNQSRVSAVKIRCFLHSTFAVARTKAQDVLREYLHTTRSLPFTDADFISKNSPHFLGKLLSQLNQDKDVEDSLSKFLVNNPINELEPFLESLGLSTFKCYSLLPNEPVFLKDDGRLLDNFHVLVNYGVPGSQMGKMFREARDIFRYDQGVLASKLQAYEKLGLSRKVVIKLVTCSPSLLIGDVVDDHFVVFLGKLKGFGAEIDWMGKFMTQKSSYNWRRMLETIECMQEVGCNGKQFKALFEADPTMLFEGSGKKVYVLLALLVKLGLEPNDISSLVIGTPKILSPTHAKYLIQAVLFLLEIGMEAEGCAEIVLKHVKLLCSCSFKKPKIVCEELSIDEESLLQMIREDSMKLFSLAGRPKAKINNGVRVRKVLVKQTFLIRLGYAENSGEMAMAMQRFTGRPEQLQERFDCLIKAGLDPITASSIVKRVPRVLSQTAESIEKKLELLTGYMGYPVSALETFPTYLCYDVEKIRRRYRMSLWLSKRGALKQNGSLSIILACSDRRFASYFAHITDGPAMWEVLSAGQT
ncbi:Transcription termination factor MTEF18, mitochondrial [Linum perenne]